MAQTRQCRRGATGASMNIKECDLLIFEHESGVPRIAPVSGAIEELYSSRHIRILKMFDIAATPEKGRDVVRVDIYKD